MKKISMLLTLFLVSISISVLFTNSAHASTGEEDTALKIQNILDKYEVNEPFSDEDTQYLKENSALNNNITYIQNKGDVSVFSVSKKFFTGNNKTLALTGYVEYDNGFGKNSWNFYMDAWDTVGIKRNIRAEVKIDCVGIVNFETGAIGKIYNNTVSQTSSGKVDFLTLNKSDSFTGLPMFVYYYPKATFDGVDLAGEFR
ncbi:hypothetical protein ABGV40_30120 [Paenibacillus amylolyticus]|uniref:hypothetical protein n=1 Tax=Paenibacillus amylolyticus TaxID=1451 RepID=UPI0032429440